MNTLSADTQPDMSSNPFAAPESATHDGGLVEAQEPILFPTTVTKMVTMNILTLNLYSLYWFYKNWAYIRKARGEGHPVLYAIFSVFSVFSLCKWVATEAGERNIHMPWSVQAPALLYFVAAFGSRVGDRLAGPAALLGFVGFVMCLALIPVQRTINDINEQERPGLEINSRFSAVNILFMVLGGILLLMALVGSVSTVMGLV